MEGRHAQALTTLRGQPFHLPSLHPAMLIGESAALSRLRHDTQRAQLAEQQTQACLLRLHPELD